MQFDSVSDFFNMGGYAFYVWLSYGITLGSIVMLVLLSARRKQTVLKEIAKQASREKRLKENRGNKS
jgi:heme exporter protein D